MKREIKIGLTVIGAIILLYLSLLWLGKSSISGATNTYSIQFDHVSGLLEGDPVMVRGYEAGKVNEINIRPKEVLVSIEIKRSIPLFNDATAEIQPKELMGGKQIELTQGRSTVPIDPKGFISGSRSMDFSSGFSAFGKILNNEGSTSLVNAIARLDTLSSILTHLFQAINPEKISTTVDYAEHNMFLLERLLEDINSQRLSSKVSKGLDSLSNVSQQASRLIKSMQSITGKLDGGMIDQLSESSKKLPSIVAKIDTSLGSINHLLQGLDNQEGLASRVLDDPVLSHRLDTLMINLNLVLEQIHKEKIIIGLRRPKNKKQ